MRQPQIPQANLQASQEALKRGQRREMINFPLEIQNLHKTRAYILKRFVGGSGKPQKFNSLTVYKVWATLPKSRRPKQEEEIEVCVSNNGSVAILSPWQASNGFMLTRWSEARLKAYLENPLLSWHDLMEL